MIEPQVEALLRDLAVRFPLIRLNPPVEVKMVFRSMGKLPGGVEKDLRTFLEFSNGASLLDYCFLGCKNPRIPDIRDTTMQMWPINTWMARGVIPFVLSSVNEVFGYIHSSVSSSGSHPVVYMENSLARRSTPVASSVGTFLKGMVEDLETTLEQNPDAISVELKNWPRDLDHWSNRDETLMELIEGGTFSDFL